MKKLASSIVSFFLILLGIAGLADCLVISGSINLSEGQCSGFGSCDKVLNSTYANIGGVSLWKFGAAFYLLYTTLLITAILRHRRTMLFFCILLVSGGSLCSLYLIYLQAFRIHSWCPLCLLSAAIQFLSLLGCLYLWFCKKEVDSFNQKSNQHAWKVEFVTSLLIFLVMFSGLLSLSSKLWDKVEAVDTSESQRNLIVTQLDDELVSLSDFPEYMTMRKEFDQFIWTRAKQWYRAKVLSYAAKKKGFSDSTAFVHDAYIKSGGMIDIDADETVRRFMAFKKEYENSGKTVPSDEVLMAELQERHQKMYNDFVIALTETVEKELGAEYLLRPPSIDLALDSKLMPIIGPDTAPIQIIEISDFHCVHCRKMHQMIEDIRQEIGPERIQVAYVNHYWDALPHGMTVEESTLTFRASYAAWQQGKFWEYAELVFDNQDRSDIDSLSNLKKLAFSLELDIEKFEKDIESSAAHAFVQAQRPFQERAYAEKPPTLLINGFFVKATRESILRKIAEISPEILR